MEGLCDKNCSCCCILCDQNITSELSIEGVLWLTLAVLCMLDSIRMNIGMCVYMYYMAHLSMVLILHHTTGQAGTR